jgi:hypothetical protein
MKVAQHASTGSAYVSRKTSPGKGRLKDIDCGGSSLSKALGPLPNVNPVAGLRIAPARRPCAKPEPSPVGLGTNLTAVERQSTFLFKKTYMPAQSEMT